MPGYVWGFAAFAVPFVATPGASTAVVLRNSVGGGVRSGVATAVGVNVGSIVYGVLTAFGLSLALQRWPQVWGVLRIGGVCYLGWLGIRSLMRAFSPPRIRLDLAARSQRAISPVATSYWRRGREGFLTNALNPSIATFYLIILPQFIPSNARFARSALLLTAVHVGLAFSWHLSWAAAGGSLAAVLGRSRPRRILEGLTGAALLWLGIRLLT